MIYKIQYKASVIKDLRNTEKKEAGALLDTVVDAIATNPEKGVRARDEFKELLRYRIGNHLIIYAILGDTVLILRIDHWKRIYEHGRTGTS